MLSREIQQGRREVLPSYSPDKRCPYKVVEKGKEEEKQEEEEGKKGREGKVKEEKEEPD